MGLLEEYEKRCLEEPHPRKAPVVAVSDLPPYRYSFNTGDKFPGGFGPTELLLDDYWTLRQRSAQLFEQNLYARGLIRRLITNEINTGLHLEATPRERILGFKRDGLDEWTEDVEQRFGLWESAANVCDHRQLATFGVLQAEARREALVSGDVLVRIRQDQRTRLPRIHLISGNAVQTPFGMERETRGRRIEHGVELDDNGRHIAFWVYQRDGSIQRLPAFGPKTGRRMAWLVYGSDKRLDDVRGKPLLALVLQSLKEIDRYRDSVQRKAVINAMIAMFIKRDATGKPPSGSFGRSAITRGIDETIDSKGEKKTYRTQEMIPGLVLDELSEGESPEGFRPHGVDEKFGDFEQAIMQSVAWGGEVPPEILTLSFNSNYSASQAAINEFKMYLNRVRTEFGASFCRPVYVDWLIGAAISGKVEAASLLQAWRNPEQQDLFAAWVHSDWSGHIKPAVDVSKLVKGYRDALDMGALTRDRMSRELFGTKFSDNVKRLRIENEQLAQALLPLEKLEALAKRLTAAAGGSGSSREDDKDDPESINREDDDDEASAA